MSLNAKGYKNPQYLVFQNGVHKKIVGTQIVKDRDHR